MAETEKERLLKQLAQLKNERTSFEPHWRDLSDFINPRVPASWCQTLTVTIAATPRLLTRQAQWLSASCPVA